MKLIIKQYLESLKERNELDALLPDLLSQMGLEVFLRPGIGSRQYGVDLGAVGKINGDTEKVYLFSIKSGDLGRKDWDGGSPQDLRPSLNEILDVFIPNHMPAEHKGKVIEVCLCFGGEIKEEVRQNVSAYQKANSTEKISFVEWNGDRLAALIERHFLREELLPENCRQLLRKSLAMLDEPSISFKNFQLLVMSLCESAGSNPKSGVTVIRQLYICTWILFSWCREENNVESAYKASELVLLRSWDLSRRHAGKKGKSVREMFGVLEAIYMLNIQVASYYLETNILPYKDSLHALSSGVNPSCSVDTNLKMFDVLGRTAMTGIWVYWLLSRLDAKDSQAIELLSQAYFDHQSAIKKIILNNPILFSPYKDDQIIDISLAAWFLALDPANHGDVQGWLFGIMESTYVRFRDNGIYPTNIDTYAELIEHPVDDSEEYRQSVTKGAVLYPVISAFSAILGFKETYDLVKKIKSEFLLHCNFQIWFLDEASENHLYSHSENHGATLSHVSLDGEPSEYINEILKECEISNYFSKLSAVKYSVWPIVLLACRHYRLPIPIDFLVDMYRQLCPSEGSIEAVE